MTDHRPERVAERVRSELAQLLRTEVRDPRVRMAAVTSVSMSSDLRHATVRVSVLAEPDRQQACVAALRRASGFLRRLLAPRLALRAVPELRFQLDRGAEHAMHMTALLDDLECERPQAEGDDDADPGS